MKIRTIAVNAIVAALYIAITAIIQPIAFLALQFRVSEMFNHLIVFDKKYFYGIVIGVVIANLFFSTIIPYDYYFGPGHSIISLAITILICRFVKNIWARMTINTLVFTFMMFIIAIELNLAFQSPILINWLYTAIGEFLVMALGMPIIYYINKRVNFNKI